MNAHQFLRIETHEKHIHLESRLVIGRASATGNDYREYAAAMYGWLQPLEQKMWAGGWADALEPHTRGMKSSWLEADLLALDQGKTHVSDLPKSKHELPNAIPEKYGLGYVIEGSQLGASVLRKRFEGVLGPHQSRWLLGYGKRTGELWKSFTDALDRDIVTEEQKNLAAQSAIRAFDDILKWFCEMKVAL